jgi:hypothetical protein
MTPRPPNDLHEVRAAGGDVAIQRQTAHAATTATQEGGLIEQGTTAVRIVAAIILDFLIALVALLTFLGVELVIGRFWVQDPASHAEDVAAAQQFVSSHGIPIVITSSTEGPFVLGFCPLNYVFQILHMGLLLALGIYAIYDVIKIARR